MTGVSPAAPTRAVRVPARPRAARPLGPTREASVPRERLFALIDDSPADVIAVIAAPGYGKTTLLTGYARRDPRPVVWLSLDVRDDDPAVLLADLALALDGVFPLDPELLQRLTTSGTRVPATRVRELTRCIDDFPEPVLIVLDDVHLVKSLGALDIVAALLDHVPPGSAVAMASRTTPDLPLARLRGAGRLLELGDEDLAMDERETALLIEGVDPDLPGEAVSLIRRRTEGWAVAIYLATLSVRDRDDPVAAASRIGGDDRVIGDYVREELLRGLPRRHLRFMTRTSILDELIPELCDEVVGAKGSAKLLPELIRSNELVVPVVGRPGRYRYHQLFRDVLHEELRQSEPDLISELYRRAAAWSEAQGSPDDAIEYARTGGNVEDAARLVCSIYRRYISGGRLQTLERWFGWFDEPDLLAYPPLVLATAWFHAFAGDDDPVGLLRLAESLSFDDELPDGSGGTYEAGVALLRAALCLDGPERMAADAAIAADLGAPTSEWRVFYRLIAGEAALLVGDTDRAVLWFQEGAELAAPGHAAGHAMALSELAAIAAGQGAWDEAARWVAQAQAVANSPAVGDFLQQPLVFAVDALVRARTGQPDSARRALVEAQKLRATSSFAMPSFSIRGRLLMAQAYLALSDVEGTRTVLAEAREFQVRRPNIGTLAAALDGAEDELRRLRGPGRSGPDSLSAAELRVLALLPTHLSFRQIGERLFVSNNTVKSHAMSIYRKLGVSSRSEAVERAGAIGLLDL